MSNKQPFFSVIIPTYNRADLLQRCLNALVMQTYKNFEVIVCDDGSTDNSKEIVDSFKNKLDIKYIWEKNWGGPARPRNNGIKVAQGDWICFLDADDWWKPEKLEKCLPYLEKYDVIYHNLEQVNSKNKKKILKTRQLSQQPFIDLIMNGNAICNSSLVVKRSLTNSIGLISEDKNLIAVEDYDYNIRIAQKTSKFYYIRESLGYYWIGENISISSKQLEREEYIFNKYKSNLNAIELPKAYQVHNFRKARIAHQSKQFKIAQHYYLKSISTRNLIFFTKSLVGILLSYIKK